MNIKQIRQKNLEAQLAIYTARGWTAKRFGEHVGLSPQQVHQLKTGLKKMGDVIARRIESSLALESGYFDQPHTGEQVSDQIGVYEKSQWGEEHKINDEAMIPNFNLGDRVYYQPGEKPVPGKPAVVKINNLLTVRKYREEFDGTAVKGFWVPSNPAYPELPYEAADLMGRAVLRVGLL